MNDPSVSVILPVYNGAAHLAAALASVLAQTLPALELIVVDDGSTDASAAIIRACHDPRLRPVHQENQGAAAARNRGVAGAGAPYLAFLDADDLWLPAKLAAQAAFFDDNPAVDLVFGHYVEFSGVGPDFTESSPRPGYSSGTLLVRRSAFEAAGAFDPAWRVGEFIEWYARAVDAGLTGAMRPEVVLRRRVHAANGTRQPGVWGDYARVAAAILRRRRAAGLAAAEGQRA